MNYYENRLRHLANSLGDEEASDELSRLENRRSSYLEHGPETFFRHSHLNLREILLEGLNNLLFMKRNSNLRFDLESFFSRDFLWSLGEILSERGSNFVSTHNLLRSYE